MEDRAIVSEVELVAIVNETLSKSDALDPYCRGCRARGFYRLAELDALGCNWELAIFSGPTECGAAVRSAVAPLRSRYNLADRSVAMVH